MTNNIAQEDTMNTTKCVGSVVNITTYPKTVNMVEKYNVTHVMNMDTKLNSVLMYRKMAKMLEPKLATI